MVSKTSQFGIGWQHSRAGGINDSREKIDVRDERVGNLVFGNARAAQDQWHADRRFVQAGFAEETVRTKELAVIAGIDDARGREQAKLLHHLHHIGDVLVEICDQCKIRGSDAAQSPLIGHVVSAFDPALVAH